MRSEGPRSSSHPLYNKLVAMGDKRENTYTHTHAHTQRQQRFSRHLASGPWVGGTKCRLLSKMYANEK